KVATLPELQVEHPFAKGTTAAMHRQARAFLTGYASLLDSSRRGLRALKAPEQSRDLLDGYLRDTGLVVAELRAAARAPGAQVEAKANAAFTRSARRAKSSSETVTGVRVIPTARSSTSFSVSSKASLLAWSGSSRSWRSVTPLLRESIDAMSMQNSQPARAAAFVPARVLSFGG